MAALCVMLGICQWAISLDNRKGGTFFIWTVYLDSYYLGSLNAYIIANVVI